MQLLSERGMRQLNRAVVSGRIIPYLAVTTIAVTGIGGFAAWLLAPRSFDGLGHALWWAAQTVTTVGYGDVVPETTGGRLIGLLVMVIGVAAVSVITALVTAAFVSSQQHRSAQTTSVTRSSSTPSAESSSAWRCSSAGPASGRSRSGRHRRR